MIKEFTYITDIGVNSWGQKKKIYWSSVHQFTMAPIFTSSCRDTDAFSKCSIITSVFLRWNKYLLFTSWNWYTCKLTISSPTQKSQKLQITWLVPPLHNSVHFPYSYLVHLEWLSQTSEDSKVIHYSKQ